MKMNWMNDEEWKIFFEPDDEIIEDLCLGIYCTKCNAQYELPKDSLALAVMTKISFWEYVKYIQSLKCQVCNKEKNGNDQY